MTGLEYSVKGTVYLKNKNREYQELGTLKSKEIENQNKNEYTNIITDTNTEREFECKVTNKDIIRKLKQLAKTDKDKKAERRFNKNCFKNFISNI